MSRATRKVAKFHAHACLQCGERYMDACDKSLQNAICLPCKTHREPSSWDVNRRPRECCFTDSRLIVDIDVLNKYALGGNGNWFKCATCARTHPYDPTSRQGVSA